MTGPEAYTALKRATAALPMGSSYDVHTLDSYDLQKLDAAALVRLDYDEAVADKVVADLDRRSIAMLGRSMGLNLTTSHNAARLTVV